MISAAVSSTWTGTSSAGTASVQPVEPQVFDLLAVLLRQRHRFVPKEELFDTVWGNRFVTESALTSRVKAARRAIGDDGRAQRLSAPFHGAATSSSRTSWSGRAVGQWSPAQAPGGTARPADPVLHCAGGRHPPRVRHDRYRAAAGQGGQLAQPPRLRLGEPGLAALAAWSCPAATSWSATTNGAADCPTGTSSGSAFDDWVDDLETVVDAAGLDRFPLLGISQGGPVAIAYAVRHPERVSHLVLLGSYAQGRRSERRDAG